MNRATVPRGREGPLMQEELGPLPGKSRQSIARQRQIREQERLGQTDCARIFIEQPDALAKIADSKRPGAHLTAPNARRHVLSGPGPDRRSGTAPIRQSS